MQKKFFSPATLVQGTYRWYICYYQTHPITGLYTRCRETHNLNRIKDLKLRLKHGQRIVRLINKELPLGYPWQDLARAAKQEVSLKEALDTALNVKLRSKRQSSHKGYQNVHLQLTQWAKKKKLLQLSVDTFGVRHATDFADHLMARPIQKRSGKEGKIRNTTFNNYIMFIKMMWEEMIRREMTQQNPWKKIRVLPREEKIRRPIEAHERRLILEQARQFYPWLYYAILLQYYCFIRPVELRRLKFSDINLQKGLIIVPKDASKTYRKRVLTIPQQLIPILKEPFFHDHPTNYLIFGKGFVPHPNHPVSKNRMNRVHRKIVTQLEKEKLIHNTKGIHFYSWKDTGIRDHSQHVSLRSIVDQAGHADPKQTMEYYRPFEVNQELRNLPVDID